jgi:NADPH:quinone reductase-like Zn-dependent oxidoreductase
MPSGTGLGLAISKRIIFAHNGALAIASSSSGTTVSDHLAMIELVLHRWEFMPNTVLITGTSSGIGKAAALYFAQQGWNVAATLRNPDQAEELRNYSNIRLYALDVTNKDKEAPKPLLLRHGLPFPDIL